MHRNGQKIANGAFFADCPQSDNNKGRCALSSDPKSMKLEGLRYFPGYCLRSKPCTNLLEREKMLSF
jgi:hypothetical protein